MLISFTRVRPDLLKLAAPAGIRHLDTCALDRTLWLSVMAYWADDLYRTAYVDVARREVIVEDEGVLPTLFVGPDKAMWAIATNPYGDKDREFIRRIGGPAIGKPFLPFVGEPVELDGNTLLLHNADPFSPNPDRLLRLDLQTTSRKLIKVPLPSRNHLVPSPEGLHALDHDGLHRLFDRHSLGNVIRERTLPIERSNWQPVSLSFDKPSVLLGTDGTTLWWVDIEPDGSTRRVKLIDGSFTSLWPPLVTATGDVVLRFTGDGNGWLVARERGLVSIVHSTPRGYVDAHGEMVIELPEAEWILSDLALVDSRIAAVVYDNQPRPAALYVATV